MPLFKPKSSSAPPPMTMTAMRAMSAARLRMHSEMSERTRNTMPRPMAVKTASTPRIVWRILGAPLDEADRAPSTREERRG